MTSVFRASGGRFRAMASGGCTRGRFPPSPTWTQASALARLVHDELEAFGTGGGPELTDGDMRNALLGLRAVLERVGISDFDVPFRNLTTFRSFWTREGARVLTSPP